MRRWLVLASAILSLVALSIGHSRWARKPTPKIQLNKAERHVIAAFTQGTISRGSPIRIVFVEPVVDGTQLRTKLTPSPFAFDPGIDGLTVWTASNELEFRPSERLPGGQSYRGRIDLKSLLPGKPGLGLFEFGFSSMKQDLDVQVDGLEAADPADIKKQTLTGKLVTADVEDAPKVESILLAAFGGRPLRIEWTHDSDHRTNTFRVPGIIRGEEPSTLALSWDGGALGVAKKEKRDVAVSGFNTFAVDQARVVQEKESYIELRFTDPLQKQQNLQGLIKIADRDDIRLVPVGSIVKVYANKGFQGEVTVRVGSGIRNALGYRMREGHDFPVHFEVLKPQVRFAGKGVIVPTSSGLKIPIETVNLRSVVVEAMKIPDDNLPQFFQVNDLAGDRELARVGRVVWKQTVSLDVTPDKENRWLLVGLDLNPLVSKSPGGLYRLTLSFKRRDVVWSCNGAASAPEAHEVGPPSADGESDASYWDEAERMAGEWQDAFEHREDPCHAGYYTTYYDHNIKAVRNVLVSDLGLIAKKGQDESLILFATDLRTTAPVSGAEVRIRDYQHQTVARGSTDGSGMARLKLDGKPYLAVVQHEGHTGYLRLDDGTALSLAHFDVAGADAPKGLKGFLYGERGVWRPGDTLHLTFILFDPTDRLHASHPARFELVDNRGRLVKTLTRPPASDGFYTFEVATSPDAPTGNYIGRVSVGGATFDRILKIETITPNRLKIAMTFGSPLLKAGENLSGVLSSTWLHGAAARGLKASVEMTLQPAATKIERYINYLFDDPTRKFETEKQSVFEGRLDETGRARIEVPINVTGPAPGKLNAHFTTRVFEPGGAFSIDRFSLPYSPYARYVGIRAPAGDRARGMILTDVQHTLDIVVVDADGKPAGDAEVEVRLYKVNWRWWWERGEEDLSTYAESKTHTPVLSGVVHVKDGVGSWPFMIKYPEWGRFLITAADRAGGHRTGQTVYIDWPGWAGRGQKEMGGGASVLGFSPDKPAYNVGETVTITIPTPKKGRALVSLESGSRVLRANWLEAVGTETRYTFTATAEMAPNVYAHVTLLQPHAQTGNDLPIRMYGVALIKVTNPETRLKPVVECADVFAPQSAGTVTVRESSGRGMTYTLAVVDEGLLSLTRYQTPDPWDYFYAREALAVKTWDLYDFVVGAYGAAFDRMLAIGGDEQGARAGAKRANRFPPVVRFLGPFPLAAGATNTHKVDIPQYVGAVRVMVVAGRNGAFGAADKSVFVRRPLMILGTLPRVLGPDEHLSLPVSVFALEPTVKDVRVSVTTSGPLEVVGAAVKALAFKAVGDDLTAFELRTRPALGVARVVIRATSGPKEHAEQTIELEVRTSSVRVVDVVGTTLEPQKTWAPTPKLPGLPGTNEVTLEVSRVPPIDLGRRLEYLIQYPHGCVEQTTSSIFPQLYLSKLLDLTADQQVRVERNIKAGLERLKQFQTSEGGFSYWPGNNDPDDWASSYAGHFLVEAERAGFLVPAGLIEQWKGFERRRARGWLPADGHADLSQAYRLYALALAGAPDLGSMNQLRERGALPVVAQWRLAAAYQLAGQPEAARALMAKGEIRIQPYRELWGTYGSDLRDRAMVLEALVILKAWNQVGPLARSVSDTLTAQPWLSTQETAYALVALSRVVGDGERGAMSFTYSWGGGKETPVAATAAIVQRKFTTDGASFVLRNTGSGVLYPRLVLSGLPAVGQEVPASNGLRMEIEYLSPQDVAVDATRLEQGTDFKARVKLTNTGARGELRQVALSHLFPSGWELHNERMDTATPRNAAPFAYQDFRDDRVYTYLDLKAGETKTVEVRLNASYLGHFYAPMVSAEAMYDASLNARAKGQWVRVVQPGKE